MTTVDITPAKRRFGIKPRKQWQFAITAANGEALDPRDTYANVRDITSMLASLREQPLTVRVHIGGRIQEYQL